jgi:hypothetical protein
MVRPQRLRRFTRWSALALALALTACDRSTTTAPAVEKADASVIGPQAARGIALAMADTQMRMQILTDLRNSPFSEHKVILQDYLRTGGGRHVLAAIERAGMNSADLDRLLRDAPPIQFYVPISEQRWSWRGTPDIIVVADLGREDAVGFAPSGSAQQMPSRDGLAKEFGAVFVLQWAEPMFRRLSGPTGATETIQLEGESQLGRGTIERDAAGRIVRMKDATSNSGPALVIAPYDQSVPAGTYVDYVGNNGVCDHITCDHLELEVYSQNQNGSYTSEALTGIGAPEGSWSGWWTIHTLRATPTVPINVWVYETDTDGNDEFYCSASETSPCSVENVPRLTGQFLEEYVLCQTSGCGDGELWFRFRDRADPVVTTVTVAPATKTVYNGQTVAYTATAKDQYFGLISGKTASWLSTNTSVATVSSTGPLTANAFTNAVGQTTIRATIDGVNGNATLTTVQTPPSVTISGPTSATLHQSVQEFANVSGGIAPFTYSWRSRQCGNSGCGTWQNWYSTGSQNYTYVSVHSCGFTRSELEARVTDAGGAFDDSPTYYISISNPC